MQQHHCGTLKQQHDRSQIKQQHDLSKGKQQYDCSKVKQDVHVLYDVAHYPVGGICLQMASLFLIKKCVCFR